MTQMYIDEYQFCYFFRNTDHHSVLLKVGCATQPLRSRLETVLKAKNLYYRTFSRKQQGKEEIKIKG